MEKISKDDEISKGWRENMQNYQCEIAEREQQLHVLKQEVDKRLTELPPSDVNDVVALIRDKETELDYLTVEVKKLSELLSKIE